MLRSLSLFSIFNSTRNPSLQFITSLSSPLTLPSKPKFSSSPRGSISDVLQIIGPIHLIFPNSEVRVYIRLLKKCMRSNDSLKGNVVHAHVLKSGFKSHLVVCNVLLDMYMRGGSFNHAQNLFDEMLNKDVVSWCTLISGFSNHGLHHKSFHIFKSMCHNNYKPNGFTISSILKACASSGILRLVITIHSFAIKSGFSFDPFIEIGFVNSYSKCRDITNARKLFDEIPIKSTIAWNAMLSGYVQNGLLSQTLYLFKEMYKIGFLIDIITLRIVAFCSSTLGLLQFCKNIHVYAIKLRLSNDSYFSSELINLLKTSEEIDYMKNIFNSVKNPNPSLYCTIISKLNSNGYREESIIHLKKLLYSKPELKEGDFVNLVNLCALKNEGQQIHSLALKTAHFSYISVGNALISMYFNLKESKEAFRTFQNVPNRDLVSWTAVMTGFVQCNEFKKSLYIFKNFKKSGMKEDVYCVSTALNACIGLMELKTGKQLHGLVLKSGFQFSDFVTASLINLYAKHGQIWDFVKVYYTDFKAKPSLVLINVVLSGFCNNSNYENALEFFSKEYELGFVPDEFSYSIILTACTDFKAWGTGNQILSRILKSGFGFSDLIVGNSLINFFVKYGCVISGRKLFNEMRNKNENSYALLMLGYIKKGNGLEALKLFSEMQENGILGNKIIYSRILRGCADVAALDLGRQVHGLIIKIGLIKDVYIEKAIVGLYSKIDLFKGVERENIGVFMVEKECLENYEKAPEFIDLGKEEGRIGEEFLKFEISDQVFWVAGLNLGFLRGKGDSKLGFVRS